MKFDCGLLDKPYLQNAIRSLKDQEDKPLVDLPLVTFFLEGGGIDKIPMGFKKHLGDFSLKDLDCVEGLMEEFQDKQFAPYFFWDGVREKLSFLKLFDSTQLSEEKWDQVMEFFSKPREERGAWPQGVANDFISWVEKKKLLSVSGDRDISKKVKVKI